MTEDDLKHTYNRHCDCGCNGVAVHNYLRSGGSLGYVHNFLRSFGIIELLSYLPNDATLLSETYIDDIINTYYNHNSLVIREKLVEKMEHWETESCIKTLRNLAVTEEVPWLREYCAKVVKQYE